MALTLFTSRPESPLCLPLCVALAEDDKQLKTSLSFALVIQGHHMS